MKSNTRIILSGVALGAVLGAVGALIYTRLLSDDGAMRQGQGATEDLDFSQIARLALHIVGVIRQIIAIT